MEQVQLQVEDELSRFKAERDQECKCSLQTFNDKEGGMRWEAQTRSGSTLQDME